MADAERSAYNSTSGPATLGEGGAVPACRMASAEAVQNFVQRLIDADSKRSKKRAAVDGLVDGNPPYDPRKLRDSGQSDRANVNWGLSRSVLEGASSAFYDLVTQAAGCVCIETEYGSREKRIEYGRTMSKHADAALRANKCWNTWVQESQLDMVLHGTGPLLFENSRNVFPRFVPTENLLVPDRTPCNTAEWDIAAVLVEYYPPELYEFIIDEQAARHVGWDVEYTKEVIMRAVDKKMPDQRTYTWEWYQNEMKSNSFDYVDETLVCRLAHVFWYEFSQDGQARRITRAIVERSTSTGACKYLYINVGEYATWDQAVHPMYYDRGRGGLHHTVTGLGVKMFGAHEYQNRLFCMAMDKAFGPKLLFKCSTPEAQQKFQMAKLGEYGLMPNGAEFIQTPTNGFTKDALDMFRATDDLSRSTLSQYRQPVQMDKPGNPETAKEVGYKASTQGSLANTTFARYYEQVDALYFEMVRRMCDLNTSDPVAKKFQKDCRQDDVPEECFGRLKNVTAARVIGQGSPYLREEVVQSMSAVITRCSEEGQQNWLDDFIAAKAGSAQISRWNPKAETSQFMADQRVGAMTQIGLMKQGMAAVFSPSQNATTYAGTFINACLDAINSIQKTQGKNMAEVVAFLDKCGPAAGAHIRRLLKDPMRHVIAVDFLSKWKKIMAMTEKLKGKLKQQAQQEQAQQQKAQGVQSDAQIKAQKMQMDMKLKAQKQQAVLAMQAQKHRQQMAIQDSTAASQISLNRLRSLQ